MDRIIKYEETIPDEDISVCGIHFELIKTIITIDYNVPSSRFDDWLSKSTPLFSVIDPANWIVVPPAHMDDMTFLNAWELMDRIAWYLDIYADTE